MRLDFHPLAESAPGDSSSYLSQVRFSSFRFAALALVVVLGLIRAWVGRYSMNPDGMCYLDLGDVFFHGRWADAVNGYWSPLYAWLVGAALFIVKPSRWWEFPTAQAVNFLIFLGALACFEFLLRSMISEWHGNDREEQAQPLSQFSLLAIGYSLFLWTSLELISVWDVSPDMCVAGFVYLIAGLLLRIRRGGPLRLYFILGVTMGLAYLTKAVMFPLGFAFILIGLGCAPRQRRATFAGVVTLMFVAVSAVWLVPLSRAKGRFDFGDSGRLNYAAFVSPGGRLLNWQGDPPGSGVPLHATRKIHDQPPVYEFAEPIPGTYPPSFDPSYWNEGHQVTFSARRQLAVIAEHLLLYANLFLRSQSGLLAGVLTLVLVGGAATRRAIVANWPLLAMVFAVFGLYALVHAEARFLSACVVIFWMAILFAVRLPAHNSPRWAELLCLAIVITILLSVADGTVRAIRAGGPYSARDQIVVAEHLHEIGLRDHDRVAVVGEANWSYWARLGKFKIVSTVTSVDAPEFWAQDSTQKEQVYRAFASSGAQAAVTEAPPAGVVMDSGWQRVGSSEYFVRWLQR
jgi:hypothetical protein